MTMSQHYPTLESLFLLLSVAWSCYYLHLTLEARAKEYPVSSVVINKFLYSAGAGTFFASLAACVVDWRGVLLVDKSKVVTSSSQHTSTFLTLYPRQNQGHGLTIGLSTLPLVFMAIMVANAAFTPLVYMTANVFAANVMMSVLSVLGLLTCVRQDGDEDGDGEKHGGRNAGAQQGEDKKLPSYVFFYPPRSILAGIAICCTGFVWYAYETLESTSYFSYLLLMGPLIFYCICCTSVYCVLLYTCLSRLRRSFTFGEAALVSLVVSQLLTNTSFHFMHLLIHSAPAWPVWLRLSPLSGIIWNGVHRLFTWAQLPAYAVGVLVAPVLSLFPPIGVSSIVLKFEQLPLPSAATVYEYASLCFVPPLPMTNMVTIASCSIISSSLFTIGVGYPLLRRLAAGPPVASSSTSTSASALPRPGARFALPAYGCGSAVGGWALLLALVVCVMWPFITVCMGQEPFLWFANYMLAADDMSTTVYTLFPSCSLSVSVRSKLFVYLGVLALAGAAAAPTIPLGQDAGPSPPSSPSSPSPPFSFGAPAVIAAAASPAARLPLIILRKYYHILAVCMFTPCVLLDIEFLTLALAVALSLFLMCETVRIAGLPPVAKGLQTYMSRYIDHRDSGEMILTHVYLLVGCAVPVWLHHAVLSASVAQFMPVTPSPRYATPVGTGAYAPEVYSVSMFNSYYGDEDTIQLLPPHFYKYFLPALAGIGVLGIGDSAATLCGTWTSRCLPWCPRWPRSSKTLVGTAGGVIATGFFLLMVDAAHILYTQGVAGDGDLLAHGQLLAWATQTEVLLPSGPVTVKVLVPLTLACILEAVTQQIDNLFLPLFYYAAYWLVEAHGRLVV